MSTFKRRDFIKNSVFAGVGASVLGNSYQTNAQESSESFIKPNSSSKKIIVGGGGIAGLCTGYELMKKGHEVVVLEASGRHGGHVYTARDGLSDGLYGDYGMEHFTKPGYDRYWAYLKEFNVTALPYPRRKNVLLRIDNKYYTEKMLHDPVVLKKLGFNSKEIKYLSAHRWQELVLLYLNPYLDKFTDEYQPFGVGYDDWDKFPISGISIKKMVHQTQLLIVWEGTIHLLYLYSGTMPFSNSGACQYLLLSYID